jgi:hypothetical protein
LAPNAPDDDSDELLDALDVLIDELDCELVVLVVVSLTLGFVVELVLLTDDNELEVDTDCELVSVDDDDDDVTELLDELLLLCDELLCELLELDVTDEEELLSSDCELDDRLLTLLAD